MNVTRSRLLPFALLLIIFIFLVSTTASAHFDGGDSAEENPWQSATIEQLQSIADNPDAHFILTADIDASSTQTGMKALDSKLSYSYQQIMAIVTPFSRALRMKSPASTKTGFLYSLRPHQRGTAGSEHRNRGIYAIKETTSYQ